MLSFKIALINAIVNFKKWIVNPRIYTLAILIIAFLTYHTTGLTEFAKEQGINLTPWIFPHLMIPPVLQVFACFTILLFSDAPFVDRHMPFMIIRSGRRNWIIGQILYIILAAFIYTIFVFIISVLVLIPNISFSTDWGILIKSLAIEFELAPNSTVYFDQRIIEKFTPAIAMSVSFGLFWLVSVFIGILILCFNIVIGHMSGLIITGFFIFMSFFSIIHGRMILGDWITYISPISWMSMSYFNWNHTSSFQFASITYALVFLIGLTLIMILTSIMVFCHKDLSVQTKEG